jgi:hypothetical protein
VTRDDAEREAQRLNAEHPERLSHRWLAREHDGEWQVIRVPLPPGARIDPLKATTEAKPKPPQPDDPRSQLSKDTGGMYGA